MSSRSPRPHKITAPRENCGRISGRCPQNHHEQPQENSGNVKERRHPAPTLRMRSASIPGELRRKRSALAGAKVAAGSAPLHHVHSANLVLLSALSLACAGWLVRTFSEWVSFSPYLFSPQFITVSELLLYKWPVHSTFRSRNPIFHEHCHIPFQFP